MGIEVILISGGAGVGKTSALLALHDHLSADDVRHAVLDGDWLDLAHPAPWEHGLAERNLAALWANYRALGYRRLAYAQTVAVPEADGLAAAMGDEPRMVKVLLTIDPALIEQRLARRESGQGLVDHLARHRARAAELDARCGPDVARIDTSALTPDEVAARVRALSGW